MKETKRKHRHRSRSVYQSGQEQRAADIELEELKRQLELKAMSPLSVSQTSISEEKPAQQSDDSASVRQSDASLFVSKDSVPQSSAVNADADASVPFSDLLSQSSQSQSGSQTGNESARQSMSDLQSIISGGVQESQELSVESVQQSSMGSQSSMDSQQSMQQQQTSMQQQQSSVDSQSSMGSLQSSMDSLQSVQQQQSSVDSQQSQEQPLDILPQTQAAERPANPQQPIDTCTISSNLSIVADPNYEPFVHPKFFKGFYIRRYDGTKYNQKSDISTSPISLGVSRS